MHCIARLLVLLLVTTFAFADDAKRAAIESNLASTVSIEGVRGKPLAQRMKELGVPAVSYAVVEDGKIVLAAAVGLADVESGKPATTSTMFQAASISKAIAAMGAMDLVERGKLSLDAPVNTILRTWQLPENELTAKTPVTVRLLLSHNAGTTVHGFPGYPDGDPYPSLVQFLRGEDPTNTAPVIVDIAPGSKVRYSGGGTSVVQAAVTDLTGLPFATFMRQTVLGPLGMTNSTYEQPLPAARRANAAIGYRVGNHPVDGKWHVYPEQAAAGLWTTPSDLAKVIIEIQNALAGRPTKVLSIDGARHMVTPRVLADPGAWIGIGFFIEDRGGVHYFGHGGSNEGYRATLLASIDGSRGAVVMTNSDTGATLRDEVLNAIAREYQWPGFAKAPLRAVPIADADMERFVGRFALESGQIVNIRRGAHGLEFLDPADGWMPLYGLPNNRVVRVTRDTHFEPSSEGLTVISRASSANSRRLPARRLPADAVSADELMAMGRIDEAVAAYRQEFRANPKPLTEETLTNTAYSFLFAGRAAETVAVLRVAAELHAQSPRAQERLAEALATIGDTAGAVTAYQEVLRRAGADTNMSAEQRERMQRQVSRKLAKLQARLK